MYRLSLEYRVLFARYLNDELVDTYPWPYRDAAFAPWPEDDGVILPGEPTEDRGYTLISDEFGFVIRRSTSYCAWKIYEQTHNSLNQRKASENGKKKRYDGKDWIEFLAVNGFTETADFPQSDGYYVGVRPDYGEFGQLYWYERTVFADGDAMCWLTYSLICSTYENFHYQTVRLKPDDPGIVWVRIASRRK